jgi:heme exporter protein B
MTTSRAAAAILGKELRAEFRTYELLISTIVFVLIIFVVFSFAFDPTSAESRRFGPGLLWIALLFAASLMLQPSFSRERANDTLAALRLAPIDPFAILAGKLLANLCFLLLVELVLLPVFSVLYDVSLAHVIFPLALVMLLGSLGIVTVGTVFAGIASQARMRELLLPLLLLPVLAPVLIAATETTVSLLAEPSELSRPWTFVLVAFDLIFLTATWLFGGYLLEE